MTVFEQFGVTAYHTTRGRGAVICETGKGVKLLRETSLSPEKYAKEDYITTQIRKKGFEYVDTFVRTRDGELLAEDEDKKMYYLKDWFGASECDVKNYHDVTGACRAIAKMHKALGQIELPGEEEEFKIPVSENLKSYYDRKLREMKLIRNYLRKKKAKSDFERRAYEALSVFYEEGERAVLNLSGMGYDTLYEEMISAGYLAHGSCNHHNILNGRNMVAVVNFERTSINMPITDLYDFMRKILEKYNWDIKLAYRMIEEYNKVKPIGSEELALLGCLFAFPEKFFKVMNHYYNSSKFWMADKDVEKLNNVIGQNETRLRFVESLK